MRLFAVLTLMYFANSPVSVLPLKVASVQNMVRKVFASCAAHSGLGPKPVMLKLVVSSLKSKRMELELSLQSGPSACDSPISQRSSFAISSFFGSPDDIFGGMLILDRGIEPSLSFIDTTATEKLLSSISP